MFRITDSKGFRMTFANNWSISVQFGETNYCTQLEDEHDQARAYTAEVAIFDANGDWFTLPNDDVVMGHCTPSEVLNLMNEIEAK